MLLFRASPLNQNLSGFQKTLSRSSRGHEAHFCCGKCGTIRASYSENEIRGLGAPASRRRDAGAPRQERGKHLQFPGIFMLCGAAPPYADLRRLLLFLTAGWQTHSTTWSVI